jgi:hypothetical protein
MSVVESKRAKNVFELDGERARYAKKVFRLIPEN